MAVLQSDCLTVSSVCFSPLLYHCFCLHFCSGRLEILMELKPYHNNVYSLFQFWDLEMKVIVNRYPKMQVYRSTILYMNYKNCIKCICVI